jgi:hypothetical protein
LLTGFIEEFVTVTTREALPKDAIQRRLLLCLFALGTNLEISMLALHLLQASLDYINTLLVQKVLADKRWRDRLTPEDRRALSPLFWTHVNPYGRFRLDMDRRLNLDLAA